MYYGEQPYYGKAYHEGRVSRTGVVKSWTKGPGLARDFRGFAVLIEGEERYLTQSPREAYAEFERITGLSYA